MDAYYRDLSRLPVPTAAELAEIIHRGRTGDPAAKHDFLTGILRLIAGRAEEFAQNWPAVDRADLVQVANLAAVEAVERLSWDLAPVQYIKRAVFNALLRALVELGHRGIRIPRKTLLAVVRLEAGEEMAVVIGTHKTEAGARRRAGDILAAAAARRISSLDFCDGDEP